MSAQTRPERPRTTPPPLLLVAFLLVGLLYVWAVPVFEAPDESAHFAFADEISRSRSLPQQFPDEKKTLWAQEGSQPPLYYIFVATLISPLDRSDLAELTRPNPYAILGDPSAIDNRNRFLHDQPGPKLRGTVLAVYVARLFTLLLASGSVAAVWLAARELALLSGQQPGRLALLATGLVAFNPQFLFISASVNNDNLVTLLASLTIWQMLAMLRTGFQTRRSVGLAVLLALASLAKLSGLLLIIPVALAALYLARRSGNIRGILRLALLLTVFWLIIAGPWYARNLVLYGEFTGTQTMLDITGRRPAPSLEQMLGEEFRGLRISYWGLFGWFNVFSPAPFYIVMNLVALTGIAGLMLRLWRIRKQQESVVVIFLLALFVTLFTVALVAWTSQTPATQGRLLFPVSAASSALLALGLTTMRFPARVSVLALSLVAIALPFISIRPAYALPAIVDELPTRATPFSLQFGDVELLGYHLDRQRLAPGNTLPVTLYWRPLRRSDKNFSFFLRLLNSDDHTLVSRYGNPGSGNLRTSRWEPGLIYEDRWILPLPEDMRGRTPLRVHIGWWKYPDGYAVPATNGIDAVPLDPILLEAGAFTDADDSGIQLPHTIEPLDYGDSIRLLAYELEGSNVSLLWETLARPEPDLHVFLHVLADTAPGEPVRVLAQGDDEPALPTRYWLPGDRFITRHRMQMSAGADPGKYTLRVGWYSTSRYGRLAADCPDNSCPLTTLTLPL